MNLETLIAFAQIVFQMASDIWTLTSWAHAVQSASNIFCIPGVIYESIYKGGYSACKKGLCKALRLKEVAPANSIQVLNVTIMFELIYKSHRSLSGNPYTLWSWKREGKLWWHSLYINFKLLKFLYLVASYSLNPALQFGNVRQAVRKDSHCEIQPAQTR